MKKKSLKKKIKPHECATYEEYLADGCDKYFPGSKQVGIMAYHCRFETKTKEIAVGIKKNTGASLYLAKSLPGYHISSHLIS